MTAKETHLPVEFIQTIKNALGADGEAWLTALPDLIAEASRRWSLTALQPVPNLSYNFVAFVTKFSSPISHWERRVFS